MPSEAQKSLDANLKEIERLLALHTMVGGKTKGRRYGLEVLNKSAIVLITAYWEAYCEDIAAEAGRHREGVGRLPLMAPVRSLAPVAILRGRGARRQGDAGNAERGRA
jgi:hypothetical protein